MSRKNVTILLLSIMLIIAVGTIIYLVSSNSKIYKEITGKVIVADKEYVIIENPQSDYLISNIKGDYKVGDEVKFTYKNKDLNANTTPKTIKVEDEDLIKRNIEESDEKTDSSSNKIEETNNSKNTINTENQTPTNNKVQTVNENKKEESQDKSNNTTSIPKEDTSNNIITPDISNSTADTAVINYFNDYDKDINSSDIKSSLKNGFVTIIDFLFYNGEIKGYKFQDLTSSAKLKVLSMALYFDNKIEKYFPGYKESISSSTNKIYTNLKEEIVSNYLTLTTTICNSNSELCEKAKKNFGTLKNNFNLSWELIKDIAKDGLNNLKNWYEIWKEN